MAKTIPLTDAAQRFDKATAMLQRIPVDHTDSVCNLAAALSNYIGCVASAQEQMAECLNEMAQRIERIENALKATATRRP